MSVLCLKSCFGISAVSEGLLVQFMGDAKQERGQTLPAWLQGSIGTGLAGEAADKQGVREGALPADL